MTTPSCKNVANCNGSLDDENIYYNMKGLLNIAKKEDLVADCNSYLLFPYRHQKIIARGR
jgi:hypothetical protein